MTAADSLELASAALPQDIALMRLMLACGSVAELDAIVADAASLPEPDRQRLRDLAGLVRAAPDVWDTVRRTAAAIPHHEASSGSAAADVARLAARFDEAARRSPEASVALYSLGDPGRLTRATAEIVDWMDGLGLLGTDRAMLDIGCGIGRLELAVSDRLERIVGCDISAEMLRVARRRCAGLPNVSFQKTSGLDLALWSDASFDVVVAVDTFPYLVESGDSLAGHHVAESARVLKPGGTLLILNYAYAGSPADQISDVGRSATAAGLQLAEAGTRPFQSWDGIAFRLRKEDNRPPQAAA